MDIFYSGLYEMPKKQLLVSPPFKPLVKYFALLMYLNIRFVSFWEFPKIKDLKLFMQENYKFIAHNSFSIVFGISGNYFLKLKQRNQVFFLAHTKHCYITFPKIRYIIFPKITRARSLVVSDLRLESGCQLCAEVSSPR